MNRRSHQEFAQLLRLAAVLLGTGSALILSGCGSKSSAPAPGTFSDVYANIIVPLNCVTCHSPGGSAYGPPHNNTSLNLTSQQTAYSSLKSGRSNGVSDPCSGISAPYVGASAAYSEIAAVLLVAYQASNSLGCSAYNHTIDYGGAAITVAEQNSLIAWLNSGSPNN